MTIFHPTRQQTKISSVSRTASNKKIRSGGRVQKYGKPDLLLFQPVRFQKDISRLSLPLINFPVLRRSSPRFFVDKLSLTTHCRWRCFLYLQVSFIDFALNRYSRLLKFKHVDAMQRTAPLKKKDMKKFISFIENCLWCKRALITFFKQA